MSGDEQFSPRAEIERRLLHTMRQKLGREICERLEDPQVTDIHLNHDGTVWEDRLGIGESVIGTMDPDKAGSFIANVAAMLQTTVNIGSPLLSAELPFRGARFEAVIPPVSQAPIFSIRMKALKIFTLEDYVAAGIMTPRQSSVIERAASARINILISGGTGSGKTTLLNTVMGVQVDHKPDARVLILEDTIELQCRAKNYVSLRATDTVSLQRLLKVGLRLKPHTIIVGETRGGEALDMLKAWNTGHDGGLSTAHANSARLALRRIEGMVAEVLPNVDKRQDIAETINMVIQIDKTTTSRVVQPIIAVRGFRNGEYDLEELEP